MTYGEQRAYKSLSVVVGVSPLIYRLVLLNCSARDELPLAALAFTEPLPLPVPPELAEPLLEALAEPLDAVCDEPPVLAVDTGGDEAGIREL